jgi:mono/diheme cytochrome c family protein
MGRMKNVTITMVLLVIVLTVVAMAPIFQPQDEISFPNDPEFIGEMLPTRTNDSVQSVKAFMDVYQVLMSPRCMNCHPSGDVPLQGDDSHLHTMLPRRGKDGKGLYAMKCTNCHQPTNAAGPNAPPGNPNWHLPPADMKMVFQGKTAHQLAKQLLDPTSNGHKNLDQLLEHAADTLVLWGWNPGEGRTKPPLTYDEFKKAWITWIETGAYAPKK